MQPVLPLLASNLRAWLSAKGFWLVVVSALLPLGLTGAWVATHTTDVAAASVTLPEGRLAEGDNATFTAVVSNPGGRDVGAFNATLAVGSVFGGRFLQTKGETVTIDGLATDASRTLNLTWTAQPGTWFVLLDVDREDVLAEVEEFNNQEGGFLVVGYARGRPEDAPAAPANLTGTDGAETTADIGVADVRVDGPLLPRNATSFAAVVENVGPGAGEATVTFRVGRVFGGSFFPVAETTEVVTLEPGGSTKVTLDWTAQEGAYWMEAWANVTANVSDPSAANNHRTTAFSVDPVLGPEAVVPDPPEKLTIKEFYLNILSLLHLKVLVPLVALFYAAGVIADERERGTLPYLLTRPVDRWLVPVTKFAASFLVAATALAAGLVGVWLLLFGTQPGGAGATFLFSPILVTLLALFVYGAFFTLLGILVDRPYLVGLVFVLGWEFVAGTFVPWVRNLTFNQHLVNAINGWWDAEDLVFRTWPEGEDATRALRVVLIAAVACLALASVAMKRKEFEV